MGGSGDRTCRAGWGGQNFPVFYPFATWSPIERNGTLRANRRGWPGSGPPARPQESCPLLGGEGKSSRNQQRNRRGKGSCQQTRLHHVTRQRHGNTRQRTRLHSGQGAGWGEKGAGGHPSCPLRGGLGGQGECIEHIMYTRSGRGKSVHRPTGTWDEHAVCFERGRAWGEGKQRAPARPRTTPGSLGGLVAVGAWRRSSTHLSENMHETPAPRRRSGTHRDTAANGLPSHDVRDSKKPGPSRPLMNLQSSCPEMGSHGPGAAPGGHGIPPDTAPPSCWAPPPPPEGGGNSGSTWAARVS